MSDSPPAAPPPPPMPESISATAKQRQEQTQSSTSSTSATTSIPDTTSDLFAAINQQKWSEVREILTRKPALVHSTYRHRSKLLFQRTDSLLHCLVKRGAPVDLLQELASLPVNLDVSALSAAEKLSSTARDAGHAALADWLAAREAEANVPCVSFIQLNVLLDKNVERYERVIAMLLERMADVVGLQEVTSTFSRLLLANGRVMDSYDMRSEPRGRHDTCLLVRKSLHAAFEVHNLAANSARTVVLGRFVAHGRTVSVATFHLESDFFNEEAERKKGKQLRAIVKQLDATDAHTLWCMGDSNLTGGQFLALDNELVAEAGVSDAWLALHDTDENQKSKEWKQTHASWCGSENALIPYRHEHHRPDRVLLRRGGRIAHIELLRGVYLPSPEHSEVEQLFPFSDHWGLAGRVQLVEE
jgi:endonuclease/exonuclease/phosphatase family metal-dependent hydrolase